MKVGQYRAHKGDRKSDKTMSKQGWIASYSLPLKPNLIMVDNYTLPLVLAVTKSNSNWFEKA